ncbi:MAG: hypothetical protein LBE12_20890 [Planctomycetaceae bacterium]|jgi:hypothetical protein|nr:hypothetical protein [Planctomycetaceae bacterium]
MTSDLSQTARPVAISFKDFRDEEIINFFANENRMFHPETKHKSFGCSRLVGAPHFPIEHKGTAAFRVSFRSNGLQLQQEKCSSRNSILRAEPLGTIPVPPDIFTFANQTNNTHAAITKKHSSKNHSPNPKRKQLKTIEPAFEKSSHSLISVLLPEQTDRKQAIKIVCDPLENRTKKNILRSANTPIKKIEPVKEEPTKEIEHTEKTEPTEKIESITKQLFKHVQETDVQLDRLIETWPRLSSQLKETITTLLEVSEKDDFIL